MNGHSKDITIVVIDSKQYLATTWAINHTKEFFPDSPVLVFSDIDFYPERSKFVPVPKFNRYQHSMICLAAPGMYVETEYALFIQWDGMPAQAEYWRDEFLEYDYIGAPWYWQPQGYQVGNGGFSLRSKRLLELTPVLQQRFGTGIDSHWLEDGLIGIHYRDWLESEGVKFAPLELAKQFSKEHPHQPAPCFGFHHYITANHFLPKDKLEHWKTLILR